MKKKRNSKISADKVWSVVQAMVFACAFLVACGSGASPKETDETGTASETLSGEELPVVRLSIWGAENSQELLQSAMERFAAEHADEVALEYTISVEEEDTCKETVLANPAAAADVFAFVDDQLSELYEAGALLEITDGAREILASVGGSESGTASAVMRDGKLYAYPLSASNGYFLYYNKAYLSERDVETLDRILEVAAENGKKLTIDYENGWYLYSFFKGAGLTMEANEDGSANLCNWNATDTKYTGVDVAEALLAIAGSDGFADLGDDGFVEGVRSGEIIAGVNGAWNASKIAEAWGEDYAAAKLPTYTLAGDQVQMSSFIGYKMIGVNAHTASPEWSMKVAAYLTNAENQLARFEAIGESPANVEAAESEEVQASPALAALAEQAQYGYRQSVAVPFWDASKKFGITIAGGNPDGQDLQTLLDTMTEQITAPVPAGDE